MSWHSVDFSTGPCGWQKNLDAQITKTIGTCLGSITCQRALGVLTEQKCVVLAERTDVVLDAATEIQCQVHRSW